MGRKVCLVLIWLVCVFQKLKLDYEQDLRELVNKLCKIKDVENFISLYIYSPPLRPNEDSDELSPGEDRWIYRHKKVDGMETSCSHLRPSARDIVRRYYAILPYFDKEHSNTAFLHKLRGTIYAMSEGEDVLDKEAAFYATVLTPVIFLQQYRDTWCLLERFHRAIRLYQISHPTEKRSALKILQNLRSVTQKIRTFVYDLPGPSTPSRTTTFSDVEEEDLHDKKDIKYVSELIKNLG